MNETPKNIEKLSMQDAFIAHRGVLVAYISRYLLNPEDVEDILQETFLKSLVASRQKDILSPRSYLFIVARNLMFGKLRKKSRDIMKEIGEIDERYLASNDVPADISLHQKQKMTAFITATNQLPSQCRRVFLMRKLMGLSQVEISQELGISKSTVERHITNAIKKCQLIMAKEGYEVGVKHTDKTLVPLKQVRADD
ncbi:MAG: sigma-70 family RNA polymerase sigma factor [Robiginitomaculum sp.]|nr:sigma-70 family RNA polymerase sigma factor [Robiginitomaculum sp.]